MKNLVVIALLLKLSFVVGQADSLAPINDTLPKVVESADSIIVEKKRDIEVTFVKEHVLNSADSTYFNLCKVTNNTSKNINGEFQLHFAPGWKLFGAESQTVSIQPNETKIFPIRLSLPSGVVGGTAYVIDGTFTYKEGISSGVAYVQVPLKAKWDMKVDETTLYFNEYYENVEFQVYLKNEGNGEELINLKFQVGNLLAIPELNEHSIYIPLSPYSDTTLKYSVIRNPLVSDEEKELIKNNWSASVVSVSGKTSSSERGVRKNVWIRDLDNNAYIPRNESSTPLNVDVAVYNLLSTVSPRINTRVYGEIQFKGDQDLTYSGALRNVFINGTSFNSVFKNPYNSTFRLNYRYKDVFQVNVGEIYPRSMHSTRGWGIVGRYFLNKSDYVEASYVIGKYYPTTLININGYKKIKKVPLSLGVTYENNKLLYYKAFSVEAGSAISIDKHNSVRASVMSTFMGIDLTQGGTIPNISNMVGFSYNVGYVSRYKKFTGSINTNNHQFNMLRYRANNRINANVRYTINKKSDVSGYGTFNEIGASRNPFSDSLAKTSYFYKNINSRVTYNRVLSEVMSMQAGPTMRILNRFNNNDSTLLNFSNRFVGLYGMLRFKVKENRYASVSSSIGLASYKNHLASSIKYEQLVNWSISGSLSDRNWGGSVAYFLGPNFFVTNDFFIFSGNNIETVSLRAHHTKRMLSGRVKINSYGTYYLQLPSDRQTFVVGSRTDIIFQQMWSGFINFNYYMNSTDDEEFGIVNHRNFALHAGVHKAFDIPQPRIKYHDLKVLCFNDLNGSGERDENEPLLSNIMLDVKSDKGLNDFPFGEVQLVTNTEGEINIKDIPEGDFFLKFSALYNLERLFNLNGDNQRLTVTQDMTLFVPYVESYKVKGSVVLIRDEYSTNGLINVGGIRITAYTEGGQTYSALTDADGQYILSVPQAGVYKIRVNNIFGEKFEIDKEEFVIQFNGLKTFNVDFKFFEGKRKVNMNGGNFFNFSSLNTDEGIGDNSITTNVENTTNNEPVESIYVSDSLMKSAEEMNQNIDAISVENVKTITGSIDPDKVKFMVELGIYVDDVPVDVANKMMELGIVPTPIQVQGMTIYATQVVSTHGEAKALHEKITGAGFTQAILVGSYDGKVISEEKAIAYKNQ